MVRSSGHRFFIFINGRAGMPSKVFIIKSDGLGRGDDDLGQVLMSSFLRHLGESREKPAAMIFLNAGVRLVCEGSLCLAHLKKLEEQGVEILACSTCLDYFELMDRQRVGKPTTMAKTIESLLGAEVVPL
jgi:selenium metabolism protein YedF